MSLLDKIYDELSSGNLTAKKVDTLVAASTVLALSYSSPEVESRLADIRALASTVLADLEVKAKENEANAAPEQEKADGKGAQGAEKNEDGKEKTSEESKEASQEKAQEASQQDENAKDNPLTVNGIAEELGNMQKLQEDPLAYMNKCMEVLDNPQDLPVAELAIYGIGKVLETEPNVQMVMLGIKALGACAGNDALLKLDLEHATKDVVKKAMEFTSSKIKECLKLPADEADAYTSKYLHRREEESKRIEQNTGAARPVMLDEDKLPVIRLAGKEGVEFDLKGIADDLKALKPGETLALGSNPEEQVGKDRKSVKVGADNKNVSLHHCDIRRNEHGKLELIDRSASGTEVMQPSTSKQTEKGTRGNATTLTPAMIQAQHGRGR